MAEKVLLLASVASMIQQFNMRNIKILQELGYEVEVACNFEVGNTCSPEQITLLKNELKQQKVIWYQIDFARNVFRLRQNGKAYQQLKNIVSKGKYKFIHCHSPIGGVIGRLVAHKYKTPVIYTAHGFHFYQGAPWKNWLLFYPVERFLSRYTDELLVINREDYELAKAKFHMKHITYVPGIGVDVTPKDMTFAEKRKKREELEIPQKAFLATHVAEFTSNKNQKTVLKAMNSLKNDNVYYLMCGIGAQKERLERYVQENHMEKKILFLGFREDVHEILQISDCFVLSSFREGLSVALMEAMTEGLPVVCSRIRGNVDLIENEIGGYLVNAGEAEDYEKAFSVLYEIWQNEPEYFNNMGRTNRCKIQQFSEDVVDEIMKKVYESV